MTQVTQAIYTPKAPIKTPETINEITYDEVNKRLNQFYQETNGVGGCAQITQLVAGRNNIMIDKVLANQNTIISNQAKIMQKLGIGEQLDIKG